MITLRHQKKTPPDDNAGQYEFDFKRFGVRVPTVLISPYIEAGTVYRVDENSTPLDHTSILKTLKKRFNLSSLTKRDAAAPDFSSVLTLKAPRKDNPIEGVEAPTSSRAVNFDDDADHIQELYAHSMETLPLEEKHRQYYKEADRTDKNNQARLEYGRKRYDDYFDKKH